MAIARYILLSRRPIFAISALMALNGELQALVCKAILYGTSNAWFLGPTCPHPKRHLDRFIRFSTTHGRELHIGLYRHTGRQTREHTDHETFVTIARIVCFA